MSARDTPPHILPAIALAQLAGTSLWFASNAILGDLVALWSLPDGALGWATSSVQLGFILGTLASALLMLTDRASARWVFLGGALLGAAANLTPLLAPGLAPLLASRLLVGAALAAIYPVGMKLAASWFARDLGRALGWLVGALVLGTASPHLIRALGTQLDWRGVLMTVSALAVAGGLIVAASVPEGPHLARASEFTPRALLALARDRSARSAALGYLGHMWELYAFWALVPAILAALGVEQVSGASGLVIGVGAIGCVAGGAVALRQGSARVASAQMLASGALALTAPLWGRAPAPVALAALAAWGVVVVGDSPQLSTLTSATAPRAMVGSSLTLVTSLGFATTIASIELTSWLTRHAHVLDVLPLLAIGPALGLAALGALRRDDPTLS
jgi:predicted MFS family arabinose efflux permease